MLSFPVFATRKSPPCSPAPLPFPLSSHSSLFFSEVCSLFFRNGRLTTLCLSIASALFSSRRGVTSFKQELCAIFVSCSSPLPVPKSRRINTCKSLSKQKTLISFGMIDLQKTGGGGCYGYQPNRLAEFPQVSRTSATLRSCRAGAPVDSRTTNSVRWRSLQIRRALDLIDDSLRRQLPILISGCRTVVRPGWRRPRNVIESNPEMSCGTRKPAS